MQYALVKCRKNIDDDNQLTKPTTTTTTTKINKAVTDRIDFSNRSTVKGSLSLFLFLPLSFSQTHTGVHRLSLSLSLWVSFLCRANLHFTAYLPKHTTHTRNRNTHTHTCTSKLSLHQYQQQQFKCLTMGGWGGVDECCGRKSWVTGKIESTNERFPPPPSHSNLCTCRHGVCAWCH